jgi:hypothetical protein
MKMRPIQVSTDVFQAIWAARKPGQDTEDAILRGVFKVPESFKRTERDLSTSIGFHDPRYGVRLDQGFEIFRNYKGKNYRAQAIQGFWHWSGVGYPSLNELNKAIGIAGPENAWKAWRYRDDKGRVRPLSDLRDQNSIVRRGGGARI